MLTQNTENIQIGIHMEKIHKPFFKFIYLFLFSSGTLVEQVQETPGAPSTLQWNMSCHVEIKDVFIMV